MTNRPISRDDEVLRLIRSSLKVPLRFHSPCPPARTGAALFAGPLEVFRTIAVETAAEKHRMVYLGTKGVKKRTNPEVWSILITGCSKIVAIVGRETFLVTR